LGGGGQDKENDIGGAYITHGEEMRNAYKFLVGKPEGRDHYIHISIIKRIYT
jgi:hypothetical protein